MIKKCGGEIPHIPQGANVVKTQRQLTKIDSKLDSPPRLPSRLHQLVANRYIDLRHAREAEVCWRGLIDKVKNEMTSVLIPEVRNKMLRLVIQLHHFARRQLKPQQVLFVGADAENDLGIRTDRAVHAMRVLHPVACRGLHMRTLLDAGDPRNHQGLSQTCVVVDGDHRPGRHRGNQAANHLTGRNARGSEDGV
eukprot:scaffold529_cov308-Pinguiococcus_pyrenoidosus.AAC.74